MTKLYADFISQQQSILRGAGLVEAKNPQEVSVSLVNADLEAKRREDIEKKPAIKMVDEPDGKGGRKQSTRVVAQPSRYAAHFVGKHNGPKGEGFIHAVTTHDDTGKQKVKYFAGTYKAATQYRPGGTGNQGRHTELHDTPEDAAKQFHGK